MSELRPKLIFSISAHIRQEVTKLCMVSVFNLLKRFGGKREVRSVENEECGKYGVWKMRSVENAGCGKCGVWKMQSVENAECGK